MPEPGVSAACEHEHLAKSSSKSSMGPGSGRALAFIIATIVGLAAAIWFFFSML